MTGHLLQHLDAVLQRYGYLAVAVNIFGESFGVPLPGESLVIAASLLCRRHVMSPFPLALVVCAAAFLGDNVGYALGRHGGRALVLRWGRWIGITRGRLAIVERVVHRYGAPVIVVARFVVGLRQLNGVVAGLANLSWQRFAPANLAGAVIWAAVWSLLPYYFAGFVQRFL